MLDDFGVDYIELTSPAASEASRRDCEAICKLGLKVRLPETWRRRYLTNKLNRPRS